MAADSPTPQEEKKHSEWFTETPDPWSEIVHLEHGADRTYAATVNRMVINAEPAQRPAMEAKLLATLAQPKLTEAGRLFVCRMLGLIGSPACVTAVAPLLGNKSTSDAARVALDAIDDPKLDDAYRAALTELTGAPRIGLIGSLALRGDAKAIEPLKAIAANADESPGARTVAERAVQRLTAAKA